jgi:HEAT repeat protein
MNGLSPEFTRLAVFVAWAAALLASTVTAAVVLERAAFGLLQARSARMARRYNPLVVRALEGDETARRALAASPSRHHVAIAWLLIGPLIKDRDAGRIAQARATAKAMALFPIAERYLRSRLWWRRSVALRMFGLIQAVDHSAPLVAALDDPHPFVRAAALDGLLDLQNPATVPAIAVRLYDESMPPGRRAAALKAFGSSCEPFLLQLSELDDAHRRSCALALSICGTPRSRPVLCRWTRDTRLGVRAAAFRALGEIGLDHEATAAAIDGLEAEDAQVRAMAARALRGCRDPNAALRLAAHLDDTWVVAVQAARALESMGITGLTVLQTRASHPDLGGLLARQMLWRAGASS